MFPSSTSYSSNASIPGGQEQRAGFPHSHSHSHSVQYNGSPFSVAGMSNQTAASPSVRGGTLGMSMGSSLGMGSPLSDSLSQSRSHYQPGYLMSANQNSSSPPGGPREDPPMVPTKAKLNHTFSGGPVSDFGMDSMFESSRQRPRQALADEDAPPMASVNDIVNEIPESTSRFGQRNAFEPSQSRVSLFRSSHPSTPKQQTPAPHQNVQPLYIVVFGYPPDKYSVTVEYFRSLGETTEAEQSSELLNCFRIGYVHPAEALRAVRKNGEILSGSWMVGAKWADPSQAEALLGLSLARSTTQSPEFMTGSPEAATTSPASNFFGPVSSSSRMDVDELLPRFANARGAEPSTPTVGTPIKLAPSTSAFRRPGAPPAPVVAAIQQPPLLPAAASAVQASPSKGVLGQVSDLIFGW